MITQSNLFSVDCYPLKSQATLVSIWHTESPYLGIKSITITNYDLIYNNSDQHGSIGDAVKKLASVGLKRHCPTMMCDDIIEDICQQCPLGIIPVICCLKSNTKSQI